MSAPLQTQAVIATSRAYIQHAPATELLFVRSDQLGVMAVVSACVAALLSPFLIPRSTLLVPGLALTIFVIWHTIRASRRVPWILGIIAAMACVQWIVAPWLNYVLQDTVAITPMPLPSDTYFGYFVPAAFSLVAGLYLPVLTTRSPRQPATERPVAPTQLLRLCDAMLFIGIAMRIGLEPRVPGSVRYIFTLLDHLMYVGALGRVVTKAPGWWWRVGLVLGVEITMNAIDAQFADAMIWTLLSASVIVYRFRVRALTALGLGVLGVLGLFAVNGFKGGFRESIRHEGIDDADRPGLVVTGVTTFALSPSRLLSLQNVANNVSRLNEGWIAGRVLVWVPYREPYARGETIRTALTATIVPRVLDPNKAVAGGRDNVPRFTGLDLINNTSMNLSIPGEMYANYGYLGGLFGTFAVALLLGFVFRIFVRWGRATPFAFAWAPYLFFGAISAEMGIFEVIGTLGKASVIAVVFIWGTGPWRAQLPSRIRRAHAPVPSPGGIG